MNNITIGIPLYDGVDVLDFSGPYELFGWAEARVELLAEKAGPVHCRGGMTVLVPLSFAEAGSYDALWVPGGEPEALERLMSDRKRKYLNFIVENAPPASRYLASVCEGALLLAAAGLLDGYCATTHWAFIPCFSERFPDVKIAPGLPRFVLDRDRLTGGGISSGLDEALMLIQLLCGTVTAQTVQQMTQYYPDPPVSSPVPVGSTCPLPKNEPESNGPAQF